MGKINVRAPVIGCSHILFWLFNASVFIILPLYVASCQQFTGMTQLVGFAPRAVVTIWL